MAITDPDSVLILGAGTSVPHGLGLGGDLIGQIEKAIRAEVNPEISIYDRHAAVREGSTSSRSFDRFPILGAIAFKHSNDSNKYDSAFQKLNSLAELLQHQTSETIDDFIVENPSYSSLVKVAIAAVFMKNSYSLQDNKTRLSIKRFEERISQQQIGYYNERGRLTYRRERNWVHLLINIVRHGIKEGTVSSSNKVKVITFNYDCILEHILEKQFGNTEAGYSHFSDYIDIIHVHGKCGNLDDVIHHPSKVILDWASGIWVVNEKEIPEEVVSARDQAKELVKHAKQIFACGFAFSGPNCRLLDFASPDLKVGNREINYCNYNGNAGLSKAVKRFENLRLPASGGGSDFSRTRLQKKNVAETIIEEEAGTDDKPLSVSNWFKIGHVGEMPA